jgi:uncharacterized protein YdiU (UPF0061 family)
MNTDNMSILGLTIDYGPYGWLEDYDPDWTPNTTDAGGRRYRFGHQSQIAHWNLVQLAQAIHPLIEDVEPLQEILNAYPKHFESNWQGMISEKLGFKSYVRKTDDEIVSELNAILQLTETDMTLFYRRLAELTAATNPDDSDGWMDTLSDAYYKPEELTPDVTSRLGVWVKRYIERVKQDGEEPGARVERMNKANPIYVLRNYLAQVAIDKSETGDHTGVVELLDVLRNPYQEQPGMEQYAEKRPEWARHRAGCSMLSCSS